MSDVQKVMSTYQSLNIPATLAHVDAMLAAGAHGLVMMGSVGENTTLEPAEKRELLKATIAHVRKRVPVLTGVDLTTFQGLQRIARNCCWWWAFDVGSVLCERPTKIDIDGNRVTMEFRDGWRVG